VKIVPLLSVALLAVAPAVAYEPTSNFTIHEIEGFKVYVNKALLGDGEHAETGAEALKMLKRDLAQVKTWIADPALKEVLKAPIWMEVDSTNGPHGRTPVFHYHPGMDWLVKMDFNPEKHQCVEFSRAESYVRAGNRSVQIMLHELAHAYHDRFLGFDHKETLAAYKKAVDEELYGKRSSKTSDHKEYFAILSVEYFNCPEIREKLKEQDPRMFKVLAEVWGKPRTIPSEPIGSPSKGRPKTKRTYEPTSNYTVKNIDGFTVYVNNRLLGEEKKVGAAALKLLSVKFFDMRRVVPAHALKEIQKTPIWLEAENDWHAPCACYHGSAGWLRSHGLNPEKAKGVEISNAARFLRWSRSQPWVILHEMAHAYDDRVLKADKQICKRLKEAYDQAVNNGKYDSVMRYHGRQQRHYAISNVSEYFAETTEAYFGLNDYYPFIRAELMHHDPAGYKLMQEIWKAEPEEPIDYRRHGLKVAEVPEEVRKSLGLDPFYKKYVSARGFPVIGSEKVSDYALLEAAYLINHMLLDRPDVRDALIRNKVRFVVMAPTEMTTDVPETSDLKPAKFWDKRARGVGPTPIRPIVSCGEENLLRYPGDPYDEESILVHEFAHAIHLMGINSVDKEFDGRLRALYRNAMKKGLWKGKYAANNAEEYWAEGVQSYFDTNRLPDHDHNHVDTREELREYDPELAALIAKEFRNSNWRYRRPDDRNYAGHLKGYDPKKAPKFTWPPGLEEWYKKYEAQQRAKEKAEADKKNDSEKETNENPKPSK